MPHPVKVTFGPKFLKFAFETSKFGSFSISPLWCTTNQQHRFYPPSGSNQPMLPLHGSLQCGRCRFIAFHAIAELSTFQRRISCRYETRAQLTTINVRWPIGDARIRGGEQEGRWGMFGDRNRHVSRSLSMLMFMQRRFDFCQRN